MTPDLSASARNGRGTSALLKVPLGAVLRHVHWREVSPAQSAFKGMPCAWTMLMDAENEVEAVAGRPDG